MSADNRTALRRRDRAVVDEAWMRAVLHHAGTGVLATIEGGQPFVNSNLFVYDEDLESIYLHTARTGKTRSIVEGGAPVCFTVFELGRLLPAATALEHSCEYASLVVFGKGRTVTEPEEQRRALQLMLDKYFPDKRPGRDYRAITDDELYRTSVFRVDIEEWIGKRKRVEPDFHDARSYEARSLIELDPE